MKYYFVSPQRPEKINTRKVTITQNIVAVVKNACTQKKHPIREGRLTEDVKPLKFVASLWLFQLNRISSRYFIIMRIRTDELMLTYLQVCAPTDHRN